MVDHDTEGTQTPRHHHRKDSSDGAKESFSDTKTSPVPSLRDTRYVTLLLQQSLACFDEHIYLNPQIDLRLRKTQNGFLVKAQVVTILESEILFKHSDTQKGTNKKI